LDLVESVGRVAAFCPVEDRENLAGSEILRCQDRKSVDVKDGKQRR